MDKMLVTSRNAHRCCADHDPLIGKNRAKRRRIIRHRENASFQKSIRSGEVDVH